MAAILLRKNRWNLPRKEFLKVFRGLRHTAPVARLVDAGAGTPSALLRQQPAESIRIPQHHRQKTALCAYNTEGLFYLSNGFRFDHPRPAAIGWLIPIPISTSYGYIGRMPKTPENF